MIEYKCDHCGNTVDSHAELTVCDSCEEELCEECIYESNTDYDGKCPICGDTISE